MKHSHSALFLVGIACCVCSLIIALPLYFAGYEARIGWNKDLQSTTCEVTSHQIATRTCSTSYSCGCHQTCTGSGNNRSCRQTCSTCYNYYTCYDASYGIKYLVYEPVLKSYQTSRQLDTGYRSYASAQNDLNKNRQIDLKYKCWYHGSEPTKMVESEYNADGFLISSIFFFSIAGLALLIGLIYTACNLEL